METDHNKFLIETSLDKNIAQIFQRCRLGAADWDLDSSLRSALQTTENITLISDLVKAYDKTFEFAKNANLILDKKYSYLYKLKT